ncbi:hypothetical protein QYE76_048625 [Lolium multiflorum]|uniref:Uncharacterized protein n=1 Tax=Lolium multiflorum TaxID=4521 RepID=A0AAD8SLA1_LOLMU|nr:hypothetical protein QYE76_048625 [Lolium multiflorum]
MSSSSSSSSSSGLSVQSSPLREPTPEWDPMEAHEAYIRRAIEDGDESSHDFSEAKEEEEEEDDTSSDEPPAKRFCPWPGNLSDFDSDDDADEEDEDNEGPAGGRGSSDDEPPGVAPTAVTTAMTRSGNVDEVLMPSTALNVTTSTGDIDQVATLAKPQAETPQPITSSSAVPMVLGEGWDERLKALLSSPIETLVENSEEVKNILEEIQLHIPTTLQLKLWPVVTLSLKSMSDHRLCSKFS